MRVCLGCELFVRLILWLLLSHHRMLEKRTGFGFTKKWGRRYFVIGEKNLRYYSNDTRAELLGVVDLHLVRAPLP